jgi:hypothetical protein
VFHLLAWIAPEGALSLFVLSLLLGGYAVTWVWAIRKACHDWSPEPGWRDRAGFGLGVCWVVAFLLPIVWVVGLVCLDLVAKIQQSWS